MEPIDPQVMVRQVQHLAADLRALPHQVAAQVAVALDRTDPASLSKVYLTGDGDSFHASLAAELAFETLAGIDCEALSAQRLLSYGLPRTPGTGGTLVVGTSASGATERVVQTLQAARRDGAMTLAVTGRPDSPVSRAAEHTVVIELPDSEPSPGIRTYQASLLGLLLTATHLAAARQETPATPGTLTAEITALAPAVEATTQALERPCHDLADQLADAPVMVAAGSGPSLGTAQFTAAKLIEAAGVFAMGQDLEEWSHVERFAHPTDMPLLVIAPPGRTHPRAVALAEQAHTLGRRVISIAGSDDHRFTAHAHTVLPITGQVREEFSPLLYHLPAGYLACFIASHLGRLPFQAPPRQTTSE